MFGTGVCDSAKRRSSLIIDWICSSRTQINIQNRNNIYAAGIIVGAIFQHSINCCLNWRKVPESTAASDFCVGTNLQICSHCHCFGGTCIEKIFGEPRA